MFGQFGAPRLAPASCWGEKIIVVDDLLATGGSACAAIDLVVGAGGSVVSCGFVVELSDFVGRHRIESRDVAVHSLCEFKDI